MFGKPPPHDEAHERAIEASETGDWREIPGITGWYAHLAERISHYPWRVDRRRGRAVVVASSCSSRSSTSGTEFFVDTDPDFANVLVSARGNLSANEKRDIVMGVERIVETVDGIQSIYATSGGQSQTLNSTGGVPVDNIGKIAVQLKDYRERRTGKAILEEIRQKTANMPGVHVEVRDAATAARRPARTSMIDVASDDYAALDADDGDDPPASGRAARTCATSRTRGRCPASNGTSTSTAAWPTASAPMRRRSAPRSSSSPTAFSSANTGPTIPTQQVDIRVRYPAPARGIHALDDVRVATPGRHGADQQFREAGARAAGELHRARRRPSRLSRPRQSEARTRSAERRSRQAEILDCDADHSERRPRRVQRRRRGAERVRRVPDRSRPSWRCS